MKVAIVCDDLIQFGGAEKMVMAISNIWPDAPIHASVASRKWKEICEDKRVVLKTSFMQRLPFAEKLNRYYSPFLFHAVAFETFDFSGFDLVISISTRYAHRVVTKPHTTHVCYMNSPGRMFWEPSEYFRSESFGFLSFLNFFAKPFLALPLSILRMGDFVAAQRVDHFVANSKTPQKRIKKYYKRESKVIYPFVNYKKYINVQPHTGAYYVILTRLVSWKRVGVAIRACNKLKVPLKIIGDGPDLERLKKMSGNNIEFLGHVSDQQMIDVLSGCKALIVTQHEDFGIAPLDAMACGKPVVAYAKGGALETVAPGITGEFYYKQDESSLSDLLVNFDPSRYSPNNCKNRAKKFDKPVFEKSIKDYICNILINGEKC